MEFEKYWNRKLMLILFGVEIFLSAMIIILTSIALASPYIGYDSGIQDIPRISVAGPVFISGIVHFFVICFSNAILGAVVFVNFVWVFGWLIALGSNFAVISGQSRDLQFCSNPAAYSDNDYSYYGGNYYSNYSGSCTAVKLSIAALAFTILSFALSLTIAILASIAHRRYRREINRQLLALRTGTWQVGGAGNPQLVGAAPVGLDPTKPFFQHGAWYQWQAVPMPNAPPEDTTVTPAQQQDMSTQQLNTSAPQLTAPAVSPEGHFAPAREDVQTSIPTARAGPEMTQRNSTVSPIATSAPPVPTPATRHPPSKNPDAIEPNNLYD